MERDWEEADRWIHRFRAAVSGGGGGPALMYPYMSLSLSAGTRAACVENIETKEKKGKVGHASLGRQVRRDSVQNT